MSAWKLCGKADRVAMIKMNTPSGTLPSCCGNWQPLHEPETVPMSRYGTPASDIGRLAIGGTTSSSSYDMAAKTRSQSQRERNLTESHQVSSGGAGGSSRVVASSSQRTGGSGARRSTHQTRRQQKSTAQERAGQQDSDDSDDSEDGDGDDDDSDDGTGFEDVKRRNLILIMCAFNDSYLTPREFIGLRASAGDDTVTEATRRLRQLTNQLERLVLNEADLLGVKRAVSTEWCFNEIVSNMSKRYHKITHALKTYIDRGPGHGGRRVPETVEDLRKLFQAIDAFAQDYGAQLTAQHSCNLAVTLTDALTYVVSQDRDQYAEASIILPTYASESSGGNVYRRWLSENPLEFLAVLDRLPDNALRTRMAEIAIIARCVQPSATESHVANNVYRQLSVTYNRLSRQT